MVSTAVNQLANRRRIFLWSQPRTCSNLIVRIFDKHPQLKHILYPMMLPFFFGPDRIQGPEQSEDFDRVLQALVPKFADKSMQVTADEIQTRIAEAEAEGETVFIKEHVVLCTRFEVMIGSPELVIKVKDHKLDIPGGAAGDSRTTGDKAPTGETRTNSTIYSDRFLKSFSPVFSIRHPARMIPSYFRAAKRAWGESVTSPRFSANTTYKWVRLLFDWYKSQPDCENGWPVVVDGDDLVNDAEGTIEHLCQLSGLDPKGAQYTWEVGLNQYGERPEEMKTVDDIFGGTIGNSTGVEKDEKLKHELVVEEEKIKWITEFGEDDAVAIADAVKSATADYEYLREFRLKPEVM